MLAKHALCLALILCLGRFGSLGCAPVRAPFYQDGLMLQPGHYVEASFRTPDFAPEQLTCQIEAFPLEEARGVNAAEFLPLFQSELARAWEANGLRLGGPQSSGRLSGAIHRVSLRGTQFRLVLGRIFASLEASGSITRNGEIVFAFRDRLSLASPVNPGAPAPKEAELLLQRLARSFAQRLLNEMFLNRPPSPSGGDLPKNPD